MKKKFFTILSAFALLPMAIIAAENLINVSWGDNIMIGYGTSMLDTPEKIEKSLIAWRDDYDGKTILWRISSEYIDRFYERRGTSDFAKAYNVKVDSIKAKFDPAKLVRDETRKNGQNFLVYATFLDHGAPTTDLYAGNTPFPWQDKVTIANPGYQERDLAGKFHYGILDLANPDARKFMIERLVNFVKEYDSDGLYLCSRTHSVPAEHADQFGFGPEVVAEYKKRHGIDISNDPRFDYRSDKFAPNSPEVEAWRKLRGEYLVTFMRELRAALPGKIIYAGLPRGAYQGAPFGNMYIDSVKMVTDKLVDGVVLNVFPGRSLYPKNTIQHRELGYLLSYDDNFNIPSRDNAIAALAPLCAQNNVKLFYSGGAGTNPQITGIMMNAPNPRTEIAIADSPHFTGKELTVDGWFWLAKDQGSSQAPRLVSKYSHNAPEERGWEISINPKGFLEFRTNVKTASGKQNESILKSDLVFPRQRWVHVAAVFDAPGGEKRIYMDGKLTGTQNIPNDITLNPNTNIEVVLGCYAGTRIQEAQMLVDELRISDLAENFVAVPKQPYSGKEPGTLALFHFDSDEKQADALGDGIKVQFRGVIQNTPGRFGEALNLTEKSVAELPGRNDLR